MIRALGRTPDEMAALGQLGIAGTIPIQLDPAPRAAKAKRADARAGVGAVVGEPNLPDRRRAVRVGSLCGRESYCQQQAKTSSQETLRTKHLDPSPQRRRRFFN